MISKLFLVVILTTVLFSVSATAQVSNHAFGSFELISNTQDCLTHCELVLKYSVSSSANLSQDRDDYGFVFTKLENFRESDFVSVSTFVGIKKVKQIQVPVLEDQINTYYYDLNESVSDCRQIDAVVDGDRCSIQVTDKVVGSVRLREVQVIDWVETTIHNYPFQQNSTYYIKYIGTRKPLLGVSQVDFVPRFNGKNLNEFAFWNTNWALKKPLILTNNTGNVLSKDFVVDLNTDSFDFTTCVSNGECNSDLSDIRIVANIDGVQTQIPHTIETIDDNRVWFALQFGMIDGNVTPLNGDDSNAGYAIYFKNPSATFSTLQTNFRLPGLDNNVSTDLNTTGFLYHLDEGSGTTFKASGQVKTDLLQRVGSTSYTGGIQGPFQFDFDGSTDYNQTIDFNFENLTSYTLEAWISADNWSDNEGAVQIGESITELGAISLTSQGGADEIRCHLNNGAATEAVWTSPVDGNTYHVACDWDGAILRIIVDGVEQGSTGVAVIPASPTVFRIGKYEVTNRWTGTIDEVRFSTFSKFKTGLSFPEATYPNHVDVNVFASASISNLDANFAFSPTKPFLDPELGITSVSVDFNDFSIPSEGEDTNSFQWFIDSVEEATDQNFNKVFTTAGDLNVTLIVGDTSNFFSQVEKTLSIGTAVQGIDFNFTNNTFLNNVDVNFTVTGTGVINFAVWGGTDFDTNLLGTTINKIFTQNKISQVCVIVNSASDVNKLICKDYIVARWLVSPAIDEETDISLTPTITNYNRPSQTYNHSSDINVFTFYGSEVDYDTNAAFLIDFNTSYFPRNYFFDLDKNQTLFLLQPRLPLVANSIQSTLFTIDNFTRDTVPEIVIQAIRTISGVETIVESTISDSTGTATMSFVANLDYTLRFLDADGKILSEGPLGPKSTVLYAFIGTGKINFVLTPIGELFITWIPHTSSIDANTNFIVRFNQIINQVDLNITTLTVRISQGDTNFFIQDFNFTGQDTNIFQDVNVLDANQFSFMIVTITAQTPDGNFTKSFSYILVFTAGGSLVKNLQNMKQELGPTVVLIIAVIITLFTVAGFAKVATTDMNWLGIVALFVLGLFTFISWVPLTIYLVALLMGGAGLVYRWVR